MTDRYAATLDALTRALEFVDNQVDVVDGSEESGPRPNRAMTLQQELEPAVAMVSRLVIEHAALLSALRSLRDWIDEQGPENRDDGDDSMRMFAADDAIAQAER